MLYNSSWRFQYIWVIIQINFAIAKIPLIIFFHSYKTILVLILITSWCWLLILKCSFLFLRRYLKIFFCFLFFFFAFRYLSVIYRPLNECAINFASFLVVELVSFNDTRWNIVICVLCCELLLIFECSSPKFLVFRCYFLVFNEKLSYKNVQNQAFDLAV